MTIRSIEDIDKDASLWRERLRFGGTYSREVLNPLQAWLAKDDRHGPALRRKSNIEPVLAGSANESSLSAGGVHSPVPVQQPQPAVPPPTSDQLADPSAEPQALAWQWVLWRYFAPRFDERRNTEAVLSAWKQRDPCHAKCLDIALSTLIGYLGLKSRHIQMQVQTAPVADFAQLPWPEIVGLLQKEAGIAQADRVLRQQAMPDWMTIRAKPNQGATRGVVPHAMQLDSAADCDDGKLVDSSLVLLDQVGEAHVLINPSYRQIWLRRGTMYLETAEADPSWPIFVYAGEWCLRCTELGALIRIGDEAIEVDVHFGALSLFKLEAVPDQASAHCPLPIPPTDEKATVHVRATRRLRCSGQTFTVDTVTEAEVLQSMELVDLQPGTQIRNYGGQV
jgi:hypothetical protein